MFKKSYSKKDFEKLAEGMKTAYEQRIRQLEERVDRLNVENKNLRAACAEMPFGTRAEVQRWRSLCASLFTQVLGENA